MPKRRDPRTQPPSPDRENPRLSLSEFVTLDAPRGDATVTVDGVGVKVTSLDRVYFPESRVTKYHLLRYYALAGPLMIPFLRGRPAILQRYPRGIAHPKFFQHDLPDAPDYVEIARMRNEEGRQIDYAVFTGLASLLYLANLGTIEVHPWHSRRSSIDRPDWLALDLDPHGAPWRSVVRIALAIRELLEERSLAGFPKTSGSSGLHVYVPLEARYRYARVADYARDLSSEIARRLPKIATVERPLAKRQRSQVYVDWLQNARGKTMAAPLSVRGKPAATVSMPLSWTQVERGVDVRDFTISNALQLIARDDPWRSFFESRQKLPPVRRMASVLH
jgi:bifunctional non-homologous end joining protein LigD